MFVTRAATTRILNNLQRFNTAGTVTYCFHQRETKQQLHTTPQPLLAGHSKWANIKHIKAQKDGERAAIFTRLTRQIRLAVQEGGSIDPALNSQLRSIIDEALRKNMPMGTIQNSIKRTQQNKAELKKYRLEIRYKQKVFAVCVLYTDNFAQIKMDMSTLLRKAGASFVDAAHLFDDFGLIEASLDKATLFKPNEVEEKVTEDAIECGAEEVEVIDAAKGSVNFICGPIDLNNVRKALEEKGYTVENMEHIYAAKTMVQLTPDELKAYEVFVKKLQDIPGLEDVYDNVEQND